MLVSFPFGGISPVYQPGMAESMEHNAKLIILVSVSHRSLRKSHIIGERQFQVVFTVWSGNLGAGTLRPLEIIIGFAFGVGFAVHFEAFIFIKFSDLLICL